MLKLNDDIVINLNRDGGMDAWLGWRAKYRPLPHPLEPVQASYDGLMLETFGPDLEHVRNTPGPNVWTLIDEDGEQFIVSGYRTVNRLGYFITEVGHA